MGIFPDYSRTVGVFLSQTSETVLFIKVRITVIAKLRISVLTRSHPDEVAVPVFHRLKPFQRSFIAFWGSIASACENNVGHLAATADSCSIFNLSSRNRVVSCDR